MYHFWLIPSTLTHSLLLAGLPKPTCREIASPRTHRVRIIRDVGGHRRQHEVFSGGVERIRERTSAGRLSHRIQPVELDRVHSGNLSRMSILPITFLEAVVVNGKGPVGTDLPRPDSVATVRAVICDSVLVCQAAESNLPASTTTRAPATDQGWLSLRWRGRRRPITRRPTAADGRRRTAAARSCPDPRRPRPSPRSPTGTGGPLPWSVADAAR